MKRYWETKDAVQKIRGIYNPLFANDIRVEEMGCLCGCCQQVLPAEKEAELVAGNHFLKEQIVNPYIKTSYLFGGKRVYEMLIFYYDGRLKEIKPTDKV